MLARLLTVCLASAALLAVSFVLAGAKPPDLPVKDDVKCRDSAPQPVPITVPAPTAAATAVVPMSRPLPPTPFAACPACTSAAKMVTKIYSVADLVIPLEKGKDRKTTEDQLIKVITTTVAPESWAAKGGAGTMEYHPLTLSLAVNQPPHVQEQIADALAALRHLLDTEVAVEVRFISVPEEFWEKSEFNDTKADTACEAKACQESKKCGSAKADCAGVRFLCDKQLHRLIEAAQEEMRTCVMQAPKVTMFNGQEATIQVCDQEFLTASVNIFFEDGNLILSPLNKKIESGGTRMSLLPVVSADKRFVRLNVNAKLICQNEEKAPLIPITIELPPAENGSGDGKPVVFTQYLQKPNFTTLSVDKTLTLPDGGSALINMGKHEHEGKACFGPPLLRAIPYVNRLFTSAAHKETERVLMLVTPHIIVEQAEETQVVKVEPPKAAVKSTPAVDAEEQEEPPSAAKKCEDCCEKCPQCCQAKAADIVEKYYKACTEGHADEATKLAVQALAVDPMCFSKPRTAPAGKGR